MIVVDATALIAILEKEADAALYARAIADWEPPLISAATLVEVSIVMLRRHGQKGLRSLTTLLQKAGFQVESLTAQQAQQAVEAYAAYGKGMKKRRPQLRRLLLLRPGESDWVARVVQRRRFRADRHRVRSADASGR